MSAATSSSGLPRRMSGLAQDVGTKIRSQYIGHGHGPISILVMLENTRDRPGERDAGAVERVDEARFLAFPGPIANVRATRLIISEVAARRPLEPRTDARRPCLEVVRHRRAEARVACSKQFTPVRQPK